MDTNPGTPLPADTGGNTAPEKSSCSPGDRVPDEPVQPGLPDVPSSMTLEQIIDMTGEFVHLNELIMLHIESAGGFAGLMPISERFSLSSICSKSRSGSGAGRA